MVIVQGRGPEGFDFCHYTWVRLWTQEPGGLGLDPSPATYWLQDLGQVSLTSVFPSVKWEIVIVPTWGFLMGYMTTYIMKREHGWHRARAQPVSATAVPMLGGWMRRFLQEAFQLLSPQRPLPM